MEAASTPSTRPCPGTSPSCSPRSTGRRAARPPHQATRAYTTAIRDLGNYYQIQYHQGRREVIGALGAEEANLLHARRLARARGWWHQVMGVMQGLLTLYEHTGRMVEWARLVDELVPDLVNPATDGPLPSREDEWSLITEYRVQLARHQRHYATAERLQHAVVAKTRAWAAAALTIPPEELEADQWNRTRDF